MSKHFLLVITLVAVLAIVGSSAVMAAPTLVDLDPNGDGITITATANGFKVVVNDKYVKISVPYYGKATDDGIRQGRAGETLVAWASWLDDNKKIRVIKSKPFSIGNAGQVVYEFAENPSSAGKQIYVTVDMGSINDKRLEWLCPPWTHLVHFAKENPSHPKGIHCIAFWLEGAAVRSAVEEAKRLGWTPSFEFHLARGDMK